MRRIFTAAASIAAFGLAGVAAAQIGYTPTQVTGTNLTVRAGVSLPLDSRLTDLGSSLLDFGVDYTLSTPLIKGGETFLSLDYWAKNLKFTRGSVFPLMINQRMYLGSVGGDGFRHNYYFIGAGVSFIDVDSSDAALGLRAGFGSELSDHVIAEIAGYLSDRVGGVRANAVTFSIGYRF